jgi:hypothetical protein
MGAIPTKLCAENNAKIKRFGGFPKQNQKEF